MKRLDPLNLDDAEFAAYLNDRFCREWIHGRLTFTDGCGVPGLKWQPPTRREDPEAS